MSVKKEYLAAALWCAKRGIAGKPGDKLPELLSSECQELIDSDPDGFQKTIQQEKDFLDVCALYGI